MPPSDAPLLFLRDLADVEPPRDRYAYYDEEDIYRLVPRPQWTGLEDEIWTPRSQEHDPQLEKVKALMKRNSSGSNGEASPGALNALSATKFANKCVPSRARRTPAQAQPAGPRLPWPACRQLWPVLAPRWRGPSTWAYWRSERASSNKNKDRGKAPCFGVTLH